MAEGHDEDWQPNAVQTLATGLSGCRDVVVLPDGRMVVTLSSYCVFTDSDANITKTFARVALPHEACYIPVGEGAVAIASYSSNVTVYDLEGTEIACFPPDGDATGALQGACGLAFDEDSGILVIAESTAHRIRMYNYATRTLVRVMKGDNPDAPFSNPSGIHVDRGVLYCSDPGNKCVTVFSMEGAFLKTMVKNKVRYPVGLDIFPSTGELVVADHFGKKLLFLDTDTGEIVRTAPHTFGGPCGIAINTDGQVVVTDRPVSTLVTVEACVMPTKAAI
eukprot:m.479136 g.479136  ORF g.479136 m.479136 type:complete len:278 (-) comp21332_c0_seq1:592-1425(-)